MDFENNNFPKESSFFSFPLEGTIRVYLKIHFFTPFGFSLYIVGSSLSLGGWQPSKA
jgi:hypothetical protein